ncbi:MAG TPA: BatA domain-containing protein, partial [Candidatus Saccharimonadales bacterium]|nr:BatA domain-containing protein [Candidatus Saccharimonadales bacterium]
MNFLAPWFLFGALAVAGPVLFHLIRRAARERMPFSSLLFLRPTPPRATSRRKLEHIVLLLLRCLALLLLAAGFARPFFSRGLELPPGADEGRQSVVLIDTSASMRRESLWREAKARAGEYFKKAALGDRVAVLTFDQHPRALVSFAEWSSWPPDQRATLASQRLDSVSPGWGGTYLGLALTTAAEQFLDDTSRAGPRDVAIISDLQEGSKLDGLQGHDWPKDVKFILERVAPKQAGNAGLEILDADGRAARVRLVNTRDSNREKFLVGWSAENGAGFAG